MPNICISILVVFLIQGCASEGVNLIKPEITNLTLEITHHHRPIFNKMGKEVGAWAEWNLEKGICRIHLPWPDEVSLTRYLIYKGHELTHCDFGNWHNGMPL